jgi:hypothetical protein
VHAAGLRRRRHREGDGAPVRGKSESTFDYFASTASYIRRFGKPVAFHSDKDGLFRVAQPGPAVAARDSTQFGRALDALNIDIICANSPQAKGRVERMNKTLQDRLVKEPRLAGVSNAEGGNAFAPGYMEDYNRRFVRAPANSHGGPGGHRRIKRLGVALATIKNAQIARDRWTKARIKAAREEAGRAPTPGQRRPAIRRRSSPSLQQFELEGASGADRFPAGSAESGQEVGPDLAGSCTAPGSYAPNGVPAPRSMRLTRLLRKWFQPASQSS